jgi:haloalkane dehalogenase
LKRVLLTNVRPDLIQASYPASLVDPFGERFTRGQGVFTLTGHLHAVGTHLIAQNLQAPSVVLEYPTLDDFRAELRKGYDVIGISFWINHTDTALAMCRIAREESPGSTVVLGGHGVLNLEEAVPSAAERKTLFDHVCAGDGVRFMRELLGEDPQAPVAMGIFPQSGALPPWLLPYPPGMIVPILSGYGCPWACSFCASSRFWNYRHLEFADAKALYAHIQRLLGIYPRVESFLIIEEDYFRYPKTVRELGKLVSEDQSFGGLKRFGFITETSIGALNLYEPDEWLLCGLDYAFIGYESKFAADHGLRKRKGDAIEVFQNLRERGILTNAAMIVGWDFQTPENLPEDLEHLAACRPTQTQFSRLIPYPGTALWDALKEEDRLDLSVAWNDYHNYGGSMRHRHLTPEDIVGFIEGGHRHLYETLGPSLLRMFDTFLNGYEYCRRSNRRQLREDRAERFKQRLRIAFPLFKICRAFAPNAQVRSLAQDSEKRYCELCGPPSLGLRVLAEVMLARVAAHQLTRALRPSKPRAYPCKRYVYDGRGGADGRPFRVEYDRPDLGYRIQQGLGRMVRRGAGHEGARG